MSKKENNTLKITCKTLHCSQKLKLNMSEITCKTFNDTLKIASKKMIMWSGYYNITSSGLFLSSNWNASCLLRETRRWRGRLRFENLRLIVLFSVPMKDWDVIFLWWDWEIPTTKWDPNEPTVENPILKLKLKPSSSFKVGAAMNSLNFCVFVHLRKLSWKNIFQTKKNSEPRNKLGKRTNFISNLL